MFCEITFVAVLFVASNAFLTNIPSFSPTKGDNFRCDAQKSIKCFQGFDKNLNIPESVDSPAEFFEYIKEYEERNGRDGFAGVCGAAHLLAVCFGDQFDDCTSVRGLKEMGVNETDAYAYCAFIGQVHYECGAGYDVWYRNLECIGNVTSSKHYLDWDEKCTRTLDENIKKNPDNVCEYFQEFTACLSQPVKDGCGKSAANAYCNTVVSGFKKVDDKCHDLNCDYLN